MERYILRITLRQLSGCRYIITIIITICVFKSYDILFLSSEMRNEKVTLLKQAVNEAEVNLLNHTFKRKFKH